MMESDKLLFRCGECDARFTNVDQLQVHQRRHEMSLNLTKSASSSLQTPSVNKGSLSAGIIGFVDETPTPTRFIRNCEEVGLFQDLQNVNPFDEDFKKAAATPSGEGGFEFTFSSSVGGIPSTPNLESALCLRTRTAKRRYSDQDTLNTPQVFPYLTGSTGSFLTLTTNTASMSACLTPTPHHHSLVPQDTLRSGIPHQSPTETAAVSTTYNHEEHVSIIAYTSAISQQTNKNETSGSGSSIFETSPKIISPSIVKSVPISSSSSQSGRTSLLKIRSKSNLKLDLNTVSRSKTTTLAEKQTNANGKSPLMEGSGDGDSLGKNESLLERNRAAAHRSRERRKQWIYGLESRCRALETLLAQSQAEVMQLKVENENLRSQLSSQASNTFQISAVLEQPQATLAQTQPSIVIHEVSPTTAEVRTVIQEPLAENVDMSSGMVATIVSPMILPTVKAKRGRPRKGEERRVPILSVPIVSSEKVKIAPKIPLLPVSRSTSTK